MYPRVINAGIISDSVVCRIMKAGESYLLYLWEESYEDYLIENNGWLLERLEMSSGDFLKSKGIKLLSSPYWTCACKENFFKIKGVDSLCSRCGKAYPHQRPGFRTVKEHFGWQNVYQFRPAQIPEEDDDD